MAQRVEIQLIDDYNGETADETIAFGLDGKNYEIDLSSANATELRNTLAPWVEHARRTGRPRPVRKNLGPSNQAVRAWADAHGYKLSPRGRVPASIRAAYDEAHNEK